MKFIIQPKNQIRCVLTTFVIGLVAAAAIVSSIPQSTYGQAIAPGPQIPNGAVTTPKIANGAVTTPKIADHAVTASKIAGVSKLIFATCNINFESVNPHADGLGDCPVPGTVTGDNVVVTPNNGLFDVMFFYNANTLDGKVRILIHNTADITLPPISTTWSIIVFHK